MRVKLMAEVVAFLLIGLPFSLVVATLLVFGFEDGVSVRLGRYKGT
jgi:hypothetical protein